MNFSIHSLINNFVNYLMTSKNINIFWNFGSMLGMIFIIQFLSGMFLVMGFSNDSNYSFDSIMFIMFEMNFGWFLRIVHMNYVSFFFVFVFLHFLKGLFFSSFKIKEVWNIGIMIILFLMAESFLGYVLIWSQMSFWACTVITSLLMVIPFFGMKIVYWIWSNYYVSLLTLKIFFFIHFVLPILLFFLILMHLFFLHNYLSTSKIYFHNNIDKIMFFPFYWLKDFFNLIFIMIFLIFIMFKPYFFNDSEMFLEMNHLVSPIHIVPEWYFLFAYDILRSIPNKSMGVFLLLMSILVFFFLSIKNNYYNHYFFLNKKLIFFMIFVFFMLSWLGMCLVEYPFVLTGFFMSILYFKMILIIKIFNYVFILKKI